MKRIIVFWFILLMTCFGIGNAHAAYLRNIPVTVTQPDGTVFIALHRVTSFSITCTTEMVIPLSSILKRVTMFMPKNRMAVWWLQSSLLADKTLRARDLNLTPLSLPKNGWLKERHGMCPTSVHKTETILPITVR